MVRVETLLYIVKNNKILLIEKKRGLGAGLYNGVGGKVEDGELPLNAAIRECEEEIGIKPLDPEWMGVLEFINDGSVYSYVHVFISEDFKGDLHETDEAKPVWFPLDKIPYDKMWEDDVYWLPIVIIERKKIYGSFQFEKNWKKLTSYQIYILESPLRS